MKLTALIALISLSLIATLAGCADPQTGGAGCPCECDTASTADLDDALSPGEPDAAEADAADAGLGDAARPDSGPDTAQGADTDTPPACPWRPYDEGMSGGRVATVQFDPRAPGIVFATSGPILYRSSDSGRSWSRWAEVDASLLRLGFPAGDPKALLAIAGSGVWESLDGGLSFAPKSLGGFELHELLVHPALSQRVFVGTDGAGVLRSNDLGERWQARNVGVPRARVRALAGHPTDPDVVVMGVNLQNDALGSSSAGQLLTTVDGGNHWAVTLDQIGWGGDVAFCQADPQIVWAAVRDGVARSGDGGLSWTIVDAFAGQDALRVAVHPSDCDTVWAAIYRHGVARSVDGGATASGPFSAGFQVQPSSFAPEALVVDPLDPNHLLAATHGGLYTSEDAGETWALSDVGDSVAITKLRAAPAAPGELWLTSWGSGTWVRRGPASPWTRIPVATLPRDSVFSVAPDPTNAQRIFVGTSHDLWVSLDAGATFTSLDLKRNVLALAYLSAPDQLLAGTQIDGFYLADDDAQTWTLSNGDLEPWQTPAGTFIDVRAITADPDDPDHVLAGTRGHGIVQTRDRGLSWRAVGGEDLAGETVKVLVRAALPTVRWLALVESRGVFISYDDGETWGPTGADLESVTLEDLVVDEETGFVYLATANLGIFRSVDGVSWAPWDRYCQPVLSYSDLAIIETDDGARWLVAAGARNTIIRHAL